MLHYWSLDPVVLQSAWLTIGSFDGVHRGHQALIRKLTAGAHAAGAPAVVLTFHPHPAVVLRGRRGPYYLTSPEARAARLGELGVDVVITHPFDYAVAGLTAEAFMERLQQQLRLQRLYVGHDFALGRGRGGDVAALRRLGKSLGYTLRVVGAVQGCGTEISSSRIRAALIAGDLRTANRLLGYSYQVQGEVVSGDGRGRTLGIPTANLEVWGERLLPAVGVYACRATVGGRSWLAVTNIGVRPTFHGLATLPRLETHLLDCEHDLYGRQVTLDFVARLRAEQRFTEVQALVRQVQRDIRRARKLLEPSS